MIYTCLQECLAFYLWSQPLCTDCCSRSSGFCGGRRRRPCYVAPAVRGVRGLVSTFWRLYARDSKVSVCKLDKASTPSLRSKDSDSFMQISLIRSVCMSLFKYSDRSLVRHFTKPFIVGKTTNQRSSHTRCFPTAVDDSVSCTLLCACALQRGGETVLAYLKSGLRMRGPE